MFFLSSSTCMRSSSRHHKCKQFSLYSISQTLTHSFKMWELRKRFPTRLILFSFPFMTASHCLTWIPRYNRIVIILIFLVVSTTIVQQLLRTNKSQSTQFFDTEYEKFCNLGITSFQAVHGSVIYKLRFSFVCMVLALKDYINSKRLEQDHPCVIEIIRRDYLRMPSPRQVPYNLSKPKVTDPSAGQTKLVLNRLNNLVRTQSISFITLINSN